MAYWRLIAQTVRCLGLSIRWTPHSPRAGFAIDAVAAGRSVASIQEAGRWRSTDSFRTYVDVVSAAAIGADLAKAGVGAEQALAAALGNALDTTRCCTPLSVLSDTAHRRERLHGIFWQTWS